MRKKVKMLAAIVCAAAWWSVFYPELCFTEETYELIRETETAAEKIEAAGETHEKEAAAQEREKDTAAGILQAGEDKIVIRSRFLEWCEESLFDRKE